MFTLIPELETFQLTTERTSWSRIYDYAIPILCRNARGWPGGCARAALMLRSYRPEPGHRMWSQVKEWAVTDPTPLNNLTRSVCDNGMVSFSSDHISWRGTFAAGWLVTMIDFLDGDDTTLLCANDFGGNEIVVGGTFTVSPHESMGWMMVKPGGS